MRTRLSPVAAIAAAATMLLLVALPVLAPAPGTAQVAAQRDDTPDAELGGTALVTRGRAVFRDDTFGDETFWSGALKLDRAIEGSAFGGVGGGVSPKTALAVGLKVDAERLPPSVIAALKAGKVDLNAPATTLSLLRAHAVVGVRATFRGASGGMSSLGITCALCHSTVDDSVGPGVGKRRDGWPNRDLNVGAIIDLSPDLSVVQQLLGVDRKTLDTVLKSWGPGKFDAEVFLDGKAFRPDGKSAATLLPAAFGLAGVNLHTYTGWGTVTYWNAFVANLEMHGQGTFFDPRLDDAKKFPVAAKARFGHLTHSPDLVTPKLAALHAYQLSLPAPTAPPSSYDHAAAARGRALFFGRANCSSCHVPPRFTEPGWNMHSGAEIGIDDFQADRSPDGKYRTTPLRGLGAARMKGGFYHDGRFATLEDVVAHYDTALHLNLGSAEQHDLAQYLRSL